jgi:hypothetical protein
MNRNLWDRMIDGFAIGTALLAVISILAWLIAVVIYG